MPEKQHRPQDMAQRAAWARYIGVGVYAVKQEIAPYLHFLAAIAARSAQSVPRLFSRFNLYGLKAKHLNRLRDNFA
jgi:hypothetical protein